jgi:hypothetical protein
MRMNAEGFVWHLLDIAKLQSSRQEILSWPEPRRPLAQWDRSPEIISTAFQQIGSFVNQSMTELTRQDNFF